MSEFLDFNESRGTWYSTDYNAHEDELYIHTKQDVTPVLKQKYGISIYDKHETKKLLKIINRDYPYLKTCNWNHE
jgi:hypothetical protein